MIWAAWRQQRLVILVWVAAVVALICYMLVVGHAYQADASAEIAGRCHPTGHLLPCGPFTSPLLGDSLQARFVEVLLYALPCVGGVVLGAPLLAGELERKTNRLAWTQGVSRTRWLAAKGGVAAAAVVVPVAAVAAVVPWWRHAVELSNVIDPDRFDVTGIVIVGYALFAVALGAALGAVLRRTLVTALGTVVGFGLFRWWLRDGLRPHYLAPVVAIHPAPFGVVELPGTAWWLSEGYAGAPTSTIRRVVASCSRSAFPPGSTDGPADQGRFAGCIAAHHVHWTVWYQPASRYWPFQGIETAIFVGVALLLLGATVWLVRRWRA